MTKNGKSGKGADDGKVTKLSASAGVADKIKSMGYLSIDELESFQQDFKKEGNEALIDKLVESIKLRGFIYPMFVWNDNKKNYLLDGHQRLKALNKLRDQGITIDKIPTVYVDAKDKNEAYDIIGAINSSYSEVNYESSLFQFMNPIGLNIPNIEIASPPNVVLGSMPNVDFNLGDFDSVQGGAGHQDEEDRKKSNNYIVKYEIIFDNEGQKERRYDFIEYLSSSFDDQTIAGRLDNFIQSIDYGK